MKRTLESGRQLDLFRHGGARQGAGRKPKGKKSLLPRDTRPEVRARHPVHVTLRLRRGLPSLRTPDAFALLERAFVECGWRPSFGVVHFSVQVDHVHLLCEVTDRVALSNGMMGLTVRIARCLNRVWKRCGPVLHDRFHAHIIESPLEAHRVLLYVLANGRKHGHRYAGLDTYSSAATFIGWKEGSVPLRLRPPAVPPRTWLLNEGWRWHGLLDPEATPGPRSVGRAHTQPRRADRPTPASGPDASAREETSRNQVSPRRKRPA